MPFSERVRSEGVRAVVWAGGLLALSRNSILALFCLQVCP